VIGIHITYLSEIPGTQFKFQLPIPILCNTNVLLQSF
jgi:hypothetical protein